MGINPALTYDDSATGVGNTGSSIASGLLRPVPSTALTGTLNNQVNWMVTNPKEGNIYVYDAGGSTYTTTGSSITGLSDGGTMSSSSGNGCAYYDNYIYFAKNTDIARYGPLNGTPAFTGTYWTGTLGKTALVNTSYAGTIFPSNHVMHRHSDGILYFADVVDNKGTIHTISTTKTTVEGDTDNGSTYNKLQFGFGLWPTAIESYGSNLVIALYEGSNAARRQAPAKIGFWDTLSQNFNQIVFVEFPDVAINAMKNINGVLYVISSDAGSIGFRLSRYIGGYTFEEVAVFESGSVPYQGAIDGRSNQIFIASSTSTPEAAACIQSFGLGKKALGSGLFNIFRSTNSASAARMTAMVLSQPNDQNIEDFLVAFNSGSATYGIEKQDNVANNGQYGNAPSVWWSQMYRIGQPFKIKKIRIPLAQAVGANMTVIPRVYVDDSTTIRTLTTINNTNYSNSEKNIVIRPQNLTGQHNFFLELRWSGTALCTVGLPITIEYELIDD